MTDFDSYVKSLKFREYPFSIFSAEGERRRLEELFVKPVIYAPLVETFSNRSSVVISGERGNGKTALLFELMRTRSTNGISVYIEDFSELQLGHDQAQLYDFLIKNLAEELFKFVAGRPRKIWSLSKDEKLLLSFLLQYKVDALSLSRIEERIRKIQIHPIKRGGIWLYNRGRGLLNYGAAAALSITSDVVAKHLPLLPAIDASVQREYFPALVGDAVDEVQLAKASYGLLNRVVDLSLRLGASEVVFILDKVDEEPRLENDAGQIASFLQVLLSDNKLLLNQNFQFLLACWSIPLEQLKSKVRFQKISLQRVSWDPQALRSVLNQRLATFSGGEVANVDQLLDAEATLHFPSVLSLANGNPRDLWHLMDAILRSQFEIDSGATLISLKACESGARNFVSGFDFYEYYPRSSAAKSSTMDVYSYISHLQKLSSANFTKNQLSEQAGTGSSTTNYVVTMQNIGLIERAEEKAESGAVIYAIRDPKVIFARDNGIQIRRAATQ